MGAGKSLHLLQAYHNLTSNGFNAIILKPDFEDRFGIDIVKSRIGVQEKAHSVDENATGIIELIQSQKDLKAIFVDESQFLSTYALGVLMGISDGLGINIYFYGLRSNFKGELFSETIELLMTFADSIEEIKSICHCGNKAVMHLRYNKDTREVFKDGDVIELGDSDSYQSVCRVCWHTNNIK